MTDKIQTITDMSDKELATAVRNFAHQTTIAKLETFPIRAQDFPLNAIERMWMHGAQRLFNDVGAVGDNGKFNDGAAKVDYVKGMIDDYKAGRVRRARAGGGGVDSVTALARQMVRKAFKLALDAKGKKDVKKKFTEANAQAQNEKLDALIKSKFMDKDWKAEAKKQLDAETKATQSVDVDELDF